MNRLDQGKRRKTGILLLSLVLCSLAFALCPGCQHQQARLQSEDDPEREVRYDVKTVGDVTTVDNAEKQPVFGVGLVVGLDGTGGEAPPSGHRTMLENELKKQKVQNVKQVLASPEATLVLVSGQIAAGARKDDAFDLEVTLPPGSRATSLRGGYLRRCYLFNYEHSRNLSPKPSGDFVLPGHPIAWAEGSLLVGFGDGDESARLRQGRIWGGGHSRIDRPFYLVLNRDQQYARVAGVVADRINQTFHGSLPRAQGGEVAVAKTNTHVILSVPPQYRLNLPHYLRVVRLIALREPGAAVASSEQGTYRQRLERDLLHPGRCVLAAFRLEALGSDSIATLKPGLGSDNPLVRFCAAQSLAYLGDPSAGEVLAGMVEHQPALRAYSLTALASLDEAVCHLRLRDLMQSRDAETRYGAFRALRTLDDRDETVQGELLNDSFWLHRTAPGTAPMVHLASSRRAEIVLFGEDTYLKPPFSILAGEFAITAGDNDDRCTVSRFTPNRPPSRRQCSLKVEDVLRTLASQGGTYPEATELLRQADRSRSLTSRVVVDALPQAVSVHELARAGARRRDRGSAETPGDEVAAELLRREQEVVGARADLSVTPTLFERDPARRPRSVLAREEDNAQRDRRPANDRRVERRPNGPEE